MDNSWITWIIQGLVGIALAVIGYFLKRFMADQETARTAMQSQYEESIKEIKADNAKTNERLNDFIASLPLQYTLRDDFIRTVAGMEKKLDKILDRLPASGGEK